MAGTTLNCEDCPRGGNKQALNPITLHILVENTWRQENYIAHGLETIVHLIRNKTAHWLQGVECISRYAYAASVSSVICCGLYMCHCCSGGVGPVAGQSD